MSHLELFAGLAAAVALAGLIFVLTHLQKTQAAVADVQNQVDAAHVRIDQVVAHVSETVATAEQAVTDAAKKL